MTSINSNQIDQEKKDKINNIIQNLEKSNLTMHNKIKLYHNKVEFIL